MNDAHRPRRRGHLILFLIILGLIALPFLPWGKREVTVEKIVEKPVIQERIVEKTVIEYEKTPLPERSIAYQATPREDLAELYSGILVKSELHLSEGDLASTERRKDDAYTVDFTINLRVPKPNETLEDLASLNEHLPRALPGLSAMLPTAKVSGFYHKLYELKTDRVQTYLTRLRSVPSRHNFFDCETILEMEHPETERRVLLIQGEMDVVSDGSDGDRSPEYDEYIATSQYYQPFTSYGWSKRTSQPNPLLERYEKRLTEAEAAEREKPSRDGRAAVAKLKREIADLKSRSFLIARKDPFVVIPTSMLGYQKNNRFAPTMGDYVVVIYQDKIMPAILGDAGPTYKCGEASLRMAKEINERASPYNRPVSDLKVTYVVFPQSRDTPFAPPDLEKWHAKCSAFLKEIGGLGEGYELHQWEDLFKPQEGEPQPGLDANESVIQPAPGS